MKAFADHKFGKQQQNNNSINIPMFVVATWNICKHFMVLLLISWWHAGASWGGEKNWELGIGKGSAMVSMFAEHWIVLGLGLATIPIQSNSGKPFANGLS